MDGNGHEHGDRGEARARYRHGQPTTGAGGSYGQDPQPGWPEPLPHRPTHGYGNGAGFPIDSEGFPAYSALPSDSVQGSSYGNYNGFAHETAPDDPYPLHSGASSAPAVQYGTGQYGTGQYGSGQYGSGTFDAGPYSAGGFSTGGFSNGEFGNGGFGNGQVAPGALPTGRHRATGEDDSYSSTSYHTGTPYTGSPYTGGPFTGGPYTDGSYSGSTGVGQPTTGEPSTGQTGTGQPATAATGSFGAFGPGLYGAAQGGNGQYGGSASVAEPSIGEPMTDESTTTEGSRTEELWRRFGPNRTTGPAAQPYRRFGRAGAADGRDAASARQSVSDGRQRRRFRPEPEGEEERRHMPLWQELPLLLVVAFCLAVLIRSFLLQAFYIPSSSMEQTLLVGDRVLVNKVVYDLREPRRGEIVVFKGTDKWAPENFSEVPDGAMSRIGRTLGDLVGVSRPGEKDFIKRVIGLPGDRVACCDRGRVTVNGVPIDEPYINANSSMDVPPSPNVCGSRFFNEVVVPAGQIFVMGDNRIVSQDSRCQGPVPIGNVIGRAFVIVWPSGRWHTLSVPGTFDGVPAATALGPGGQPEGVTPTGSTSGAALVALPVLVPLVGLRRRVRTRRWRQRTLRR